MTDAARLHVARARIYRHLNEQPRLVYTQLELLAILAAERTAWKIAEYAPTEILAYLLDTTKLRKHVLVFPKRKDIRYTWGDAPLPDVLMSLKPNGYLSHHSALHLHNLTQQAPKTFYLNYEQVERPQSGGMTQASIDRAFKRAPRKSNTVAQFGDCQICLLNGKQTGNLGVIQNSFIYDGSQTGTLRVTDIHRTLVDAVVRPAYCGNIHEVLLAYRLAREHTSVAELALLLERLEHTYPYHQAIGYCLEQAGHTAADMRIFRRLPQEFDFYLTPHDGEFSFVKKWRLFIPSDLRTNGRSDAATAVPA
jgi:predicted transcriptional regulator of viral defense system